MAKKEEPCPARLRSARAVLGAAVVLLAGCGRVRSIGTRGVPDEGGSRGATRSAAADAGAAKRPCAFAGFASAVTYPTAAEPRSIVAVDRTRNRHLDLIVGELGNGVPSTEFLTNAGDGTFELSPLNGASDTQVGNLVAADFDGDGQIDLASQSNGVLGIDFGTGDGFAPELATYPTPETDGLLAVGDYDHDGHPDLAFAGYDVVESFGGLPVPKPADFALNVFQNTGNGTFGTPATYANPAYPQNVASGDFDGDGNLDIAELGSTESGGLEVFFNATDGTFGSPATYTASSGWVAYGLGTGDFDGDGIDDAATTTILNPNAMTEAQVLEVFTGSGAHTLLGPVDQDITKTPSVYRIVTGDFNGDAKVDLAMIIDQQLTGERIEPTPVDVFENLGAGTFAAPVIYTVGGMNSEFATDLAAGDFNGDGITDIAVATTGDFAPYPLAVNVLLSKCE